MSKIRPLLLVCSFAVSVSATADVPEDVSTPTETEVVSDSLGAFLGQAANAGLILLPGGDALENQTNPNGPYGQVAGACPETYPLDFSDYQHVRSYRDIAPYRDALTNGEGATPPDGEDGEIELVKAYLALGLYAEALATQNKTDTASSQAYAEVGRLMDGYQKVDGHFFGELSGCHPDADLWHGISALALNDASGASILEEMVPAFRNLPFQLRADVTALVLPALRHSDNTLLGKKLLATFGHEEVQQSSRLRIQASFLEAGAAHSNESQSAYDFLTRIAPGVDELLTGIDMDGPMGAAQRAVVLEQAYKTVSRATDDRGVAAALQFILNDLHAGSDYPAFIRLLAIQSLSGPLFQQEIKEHLAKKLIADLGAEDAVPKLSAIDMIANHPDTLSGHSAEEDIITKAADFLKSQGRVSLAATLFGPDALTSTEAILSAQMAYRQKDTAALYEMALANIEQPDVVYLAALSALQNRDADMFRQLEGGLPEEADLLVALAEEDAVLGGWLVSDASYEMIRKVGEAEELARLEQVLALKENTQNPLETGGRQSLGGRIAAANIVLDKFEQGGR